MELLSDEVDDISVCIKLKRLTIKPKSNNQKSFIDTINNNTVTFGIGAAGTGKTFLAVACAVHALEKQLVKKIILVRPAIEAGEKLGFLPGDLAEKVDPYLQPLYDSLYECLGFDNVNKLLEKNVIEIAPLAYMRGRTLNDAFIILDEAQNTTIAQMQMFLTRIGYGSTTVVTGDVSQIDLPRDSQSGLKDCLEFILKIKGIDAVEFQPKDVMRHKIVSSIVREYEKRKKIKINCIRFIQKPYVPSNYNLTRWVNFSLINRFINHVNLIFVGQKRMRTLNKTYLKKDKSTNVLTFSYDDEVFHGDIILCPEIINKEAKEYGFSSDFRWAHMIVHSMLHLQGYNHNTKKEQSFMEKTEVKLLNSMNFGNPYVRS